MKHWHRETAASCGRGWVVGWHILDAGSWFCALYLLRDKTWEHQEYDRTTLELQRRRKMWLILIFQACDAGNTGFLEAQLRTEEQQCTPSLLGERP